MILADIDYQEQYSPSKWSTRMSADEIVPAHVEQVSLKCIVHPHERFMVFNLVTLGK